MKDYDYDSYPWPIESIVYIYLHVIMWLIVFCKFVGIYIYNRPTDSSWVRQQPQQKMEPRKSTAMKPHIPQRECRPEEISSQGQGESFPANLWIGGAWWYFRAATLRLKEDSVQPSIFAIFLFSFFHFLLVMLFFLNHQKRHAKTVCSLCRSCLIVQKLSLVTHELSSYKNLSLSQKNGWAVTKTLVVYIYIYRGSYYPGMYK